MNFLRRFTIDPFVVAILCTVTLAAFFPATGAVADGLEWATRIGIAVLFFLYGTRMSPDEMVKGLRNWRLHVAILLLTFLVYPIVGVVSQFALAPVLGAGLAAGFLYLCLVPSTVQSSITLVAISKGNVSGAIVSATLSNVLGVLATPLLVFVLMTTTGDLSFDAGAVWLILTQLLLPFVVGQVLRPLVHPVLSKFSKLNLYDRAVILVIVFTAFSSGVNEGVFGEVSIAQIAILVAACLALLFGMLAVIGGIGRVGKFPLRDLRALQFCGLQKSLATGLPIAAVLFEGQPMGLLLLPLMLFHQIELTVGSMLASRWGRQEDEREAASDN